MFFYLSKILLFLIKPLVWIFLLLLAALFSKDESKTKKRVFWSFFLLFIASNNFLVNEVLLQYEDHSKIKLDSSYEVGLVLGGFSKKDTSLNRAVFFDANDRLMQAIKALRQGQIKKIMISSGSASVLYQEFKEADAVYEYLKEIGIPDSSIIIENQSRNTHENILFSKKILDSLDIKSKVLVFSSAWHLPRVKLCLRNSMEADLFACNFLSNNKRDYSPSNLLVPTAEALSNTELLFKEWVGYIFYWIKVS
jgi:uncharacterized SAM-binding protein YcdF (DUF218 family)